MLLFNYLHNGMMLLSVCVVRTVAYHSKYRAQCSHTQVLLLPVASVATHKTLHNHLQSPYSEVEDLLTSLLFHKKKSWWKLVKMLSERSPPFLSRLLWLFLEHPQNYPADSIFLYKKNQWISHDPRSLLAGGTGAP